MKKLRFALAFVLCLLSTAALAQRALVPVVDYTNVSVVTKDGKPLTTEQVKQAIVAAGKGLQWDMAFAADGSVIGTLVVRNKHTISVDITVAPDKYSVKYRSSINMKYTISEGKDPTFRDYSTSHKGGPVIHPAYNQWVQALMGAIEAELRRL